eukprot:1621576-Rhodomonas_salina.1
MVCSSNEAPLPIEPVVIDATASSAEVTAPRVPAHILILIILGHVLACTGHVPDVGCRGHVLDGTASHLKRPCTLPRSVSTRQVTKRITLRVAPTSAMSTTTSTRSHLLARPDRPAG